MEERLQKIIARAGIASRRHAEELITAGQVVVNGRVVTALGTKADAASDHIRVAGKLLHPVEHKSYVALHKPDGVVSTMSDPEGRATLADFLRGLGGRVFPVGRLEYHASGLILLTNDGELANRLMRAHGLVQTYLCKVSGALNETEIRGAERRSGARMHRANGMPSGWWEVKMTEASRDAFRDALLAAKHPVDKVKRVRLGNIELGRLAPGEYRKLTPDEIAGLDRAVARAERGLKPTEDAGGETRARRSRIVSRGRKPAGPPRRRLSRHSRTK
jgi:23S rRNA pseudouridine2605 synthase